MTLRFDGEWAAKLEQWYLSPDVAAQRDHTFKSLDLKLGEHVLDIGTGPGFMTQLLATAVGDTGLVYAIDISENMLDIARKNCQDYSNIIFANADCCEVKHPSGGLFDCIVSCQVYEYVSDIQKALSQAFSILKPGGRLLILDTDFDSVVWYSKDQKRMKKIMVAYDEHLVYPHLPQTIKGYLMESCFRDISISPYLQHRFH